MICLQVFLAIATIWGAGIGIFMLLWRDSRAIMAAELVGYSWLLGAGGVTILLALAGALLPAAVVFPAVGICCVILGCIGVRGWRRFGSVETGLNGGSRWEKWVSLFALTPIAYFTTITWRGGMTWDGLLNWEAKARHAFLAGGTLPAAYFSDATRAAFHPNYPLYFPFTELWVYLWVGEPNQTAVKMLFPIFFASMILLLWSLVRRIGGRAWMATVTAFLPLVVPLMVDQGLGLQQGYVDLVLGTVYLGAVGALLLWRVCGLASGWPLAVVCAALLPWIKQEGTALWACLVLQAFWLGGWKDWKRVAVFALPGLLVILAWRLAMHLVNASKESVFLPLTFENIWNQLPRIKTVIYSFGFQFSQTERWNFLWFVVVLALLCLAWQRRREAPVIAMAIVLPLLADLVPYVMTRLDLLTHILTSMERLILQVSPVAVLCLGLALSISKDRSAKMKEPKENKPVDV